MFEEFFNRQSGLEHLVNTLVDARVTERINKMKVRIPQESIDESICDFFKTNKTIPICGKNIDIYDIIKDATLDAIGLKKNGVVSDEFKKIIQAEVANIIAKEGLTELKNDANIESKTSEEEAEKAYTEGFDIGFEEGKMYAAGIISQLIQETFPGYILVQNETADVENDPCEEFMLVCENNMDDEEFNSAEKQCTCSECTCEPEKNDESTEEDMTFRTSAEEIYNEAKKYFTILTELYNKEQEKKTISQNRNNR